MRAAVESILKNTYKTVFGNEYPELLSLFLAFGEVRQLSRNNKLFVENEVSDGFYWVLEGNLKVCKNYDDAFEQIITINGSGDFCGLTACLNDVAYSKSCIALGQVEILFIPKDSFYRWLSKHPQITLPLLKQIEAKIERIENRATYYMRKTIDQRLAHSLLLLRDKFGQNAENYMMLKLSPQEFASFIGTTRTSIYRIFKRLEDGNMIEVHNKRLRIVDDFALRKLAQSP